MNYSTKRLLRLGAELILVYFIALAPAVRFWHNKHLIFPPQATYYWFLALIFSGIGIWILSKLFSSPFLKSFGTSARFPSASFALFFLFLTTVVLFQFAANSLVMGNAWEPHWIWTWDKKVFSILGIVVSVFQEEWVFRGYLFARLLPTTRWERTFLGIPVNSTIIVTTILFSIGHAWVDPLRMLWVLYLGFFFGVLRQKTGNIFLPFVCHALVNLWNHHFLLPPWLE